MKRIYFAIFGLFSMAACVPSGAFESDPVRVPTSKGVVTCQLYTDNVVLWDHAIARPAGMGAKEADQICYEVGQQVQDNN